MAHWRREGDNSLTHNESQLLEKVENGDRHFLCRVYDKPADFECPRCGDNQFEWWKFSPGAGIICTNCSLEIAVYQRFSQYYTANSEEDIDALRKVLRREKRLAPREETQ